ncbi:unnamed protein product [Tilletia caries]|nr:unnamed protein product [Tilletia caries]
MVERRPEEADTKPSPEVSTEVLLGTNGVKGEAPGTEDDNLGRRAAADEVFDAGEIVTEQLDGEAAGVEVDGRLVVVETAAESGGGFDSDRDEDGEEEVGGDEADGVIDGPCVGAEECGMGGEPDATNAAYEKVRSAAVPTPIDPAVRTDAEKKLETKAQEDQASMNLLLTQDEDEWDVSAAATCIGRITACVGDAIDMPAIHFIEGSMKSEDWRRREAACMQPGPSI